MKRSTVFFILLAILLALQGAKYGIQYAAPSILPPAGSISKAVVIYESDVKDAIANSKQHEAMVSKTSQELRKKDKWRQFDKDHVPDQYNGLLEKAKAGQTEDKWRPWLGIYHSEKLTLDGPMPDSDAGLKQTIDAQGGM